MVLCMAGRAPEGIVHFREALRLNPNQPRVHLNLAMALAESGRPGEAQVHYEAARRLEEKSFNSVLEEYLLPKLDTQEE